MRFFREFFASKPVLLLLLFMFGVLFLSRDPAVQDAGIFISWDAMWERFPGWPEFPDFSEKLSADIADGSNGNSTANARSNALPASRWLYNHENEKGEKALDAFFEKLETRSQSKRIRVLHYGDSVIFSDIEAGTIRSWLTNRYGNGGRGLLPLIRYTRAYVLEGIEQSFSGNWQTHRLFNEISGREKLGLTLRRYAAGYPAAWSEVRLLPGEEAERISVLADPGVPVRVEADRAKTALQSDSEAAGKGPDTWRCTQTNGQAALLTFQLPWKAERFRIQTPGGSHVYGMAVEREAGVVYNTVVRLGLSAHTFLHLDRRVFQKQLGAYPPDLLIVQLGKNESNFLPYFEQHEKGLRAFLKMVREAVPEAAILLLGPAGRMTRQQGKLQLLETIPELVRMQSNLAREFHCAFYDAYQALGREEGMLAWQKQGLILPDFMHFSHEGGRRAGTKIVRALESELASFRDASGEDASRSILSAFSQDKQPQMEKATSPVIFDSVSFIFFFLIIFFSYWLLYHYGMLRIFLLLAASYYFYMSWNPVFIILIIISTLVDYGAGFAIDSARLKGRIHRARLFLGLSVVVNLGLLFFFKYFNLLMDAVNRIGLVSGEASFISLVLPVGISFYTFQTMSYSLDIYKGRLRPVRSLPKFALFVSFFPQLVAGPIVRAREFLPQLVHKRQFNEAQILNGIFWIVVGLFKKVVIADFIAVNFVDRVFAQPEMFSALENLLAVYGYGLQIFCDFSGYSDIAIGAAAMLGFRLPLNFLSPYQAGNLQEFWRRWHISLSTWLRDYLYIPLGGSRKGNVRTYINLFITMLLGGLWHGAAYRFILWGAWHGAGLALVRWYQRRRIRVAGPVPVWKKFAGWFVTFQFVMAGWILFRAQSLDQAWLILSRIGELSVYIPNFSGALALVFLLGYVLHFLPDTWTAHLRQRLTALPVFVQSLLLLGVAILFYQMATSSVMPFIYFQF